MKIHTEIKIDSAHKLPNYIGKCGNLHGHTWKIIVEIDSDLLDKNEFVVDFTKIKEIVNELDHKYINDYVENPTAENLAHYFAHKIKDLGMLKTPSNIEVLQRFNLVTVKVYESENSYAEITL